MMHVKVKPMPNESNNPPDGDMKTAIALLKVQVESFEKTQRESNQTVRTACVMVVSVAVLLIGFNVFRTFMSDEERKALKSEFSQIIQAQSALAKIGLETNIDNRFSALQTNLYQLVSEMTNRVQTAIALGANANSSVLEINAGEKLKQAEQMLQNSNYLDATVCYIVAASWFLKLGNEPYVHNALSRLTTRCLPQLNRDHLGMPSRAHLVNVPISTHFTNLLTQLEIADQNSRYTLEIAEIKNGIQQSQSR